MIGPGRLAAAFSLVAPAGFAQGMRGEAQPGRQAGSITMKNSHFMLPAD